MLAAISARRLQSSGDGFAQSAGVELFRIGQGERPQRQGDAGGDVACGDPGQFQAGPAHVGGNAIGIGNAGEDSKGREMCLLRPGQHPDLQAGFAGDATAEVRPVGGLAHGRGGGDKCAGGTNPLDDGRKPLQRRQRCGNPVLGKSAGRRQIAAEAGQHLLVEHGPDGPALQAVQDQSNRVRPDVDNGDIARRGRRLLEAGHLRRSSKYSSRGRFFTLRPRPDRLGLVMKYLWAENGRSGSTGCTRW